MGKGGYTGGSTVIRPGSDWFGYRDRTPKQEAKSAPDTRPVNAHLAGAAERLAAVQAEYDRGEWTVGGNPNYLWEPEKGKPTRKGKRKGKKVKR